MSQTERNFGDSTTRQLVTDAANVIEALCVEPQDRVSTPEELHAQAVEWFSRWCEHEAQRQHADRLAEV